MANSYFTIPDTGTIVYNGDIVKLSEYTSLAIAAYGWYKHNQASELGWHFVLIDTKVAIPAGNVDLSLLTLVTRECDGGCHPHPHPCPPGPAKIKDRTFITLDNIAQRDKLTTPFVPNGRIVRVNDTGDGEPGYYQWDATSQTWLPWDISSEIPTDAIKLEIKDIITSVDSTEYTNPYARFVFHAGEPLCNKIGVAEGTLCELYFYEVYQVITDVKTQESYIRHIYQTSPQWVADEWFLSETQQQIEAISETIETATEAIRSKQDELTAGKNITIDEDNVISAEGGDSQIVSGVVNANGTITFTDSDGNTFTTSGSSVIGPQGDDYVLTAQDKSDIADIVLSELPTIQGVLYGNQSN